MIPLDQAIQIGNRVCELLAPAVERAEIVGSVRRGKAEVKDVEILCQPKIITDPGALLAGNEISALDRHVERLTGGPTLAAPATGREPSLTFDCHVKRNGSRYKRLLWNGELVIELYAVMPPARWGALMVIRTGPADFCRLLVTGQRHGGAMPDDHCEHGGSLRNLLRGQGEIIDTPEEEDFFAVLDVPWWPPSERSEERLRNFLRARRSRAE